MWLGASVENKDTLRQRLAPLLTTPAGIHFLSVEPLLEDITPELVHELNVVSETLKQLPDWIICGGESGPGAREMKADWARGVRDVCQHFGIPFFFKQWGGTNKAKAGRQLDNRFHDDFPLPHPARNR